MTPLYLGIITYLLVNSIYWYVRYKREHKWYESTMFLMNTYTDRIMKANDIIQELDLANTMLQADLSRIKEELIETRSLGYIGYPASKG